MILAIDTATRSASLAVYDGAVVRAEYCWDTADHHTVDLLPRLVEMLRHSAAPIEQLTGLGVAIGPGSFTGVRVGVAAAKGLAIACDWPIVGVPTPDILAYAHRWAKPPLVVVVRAGRGRWIAARYLRTRTDWKRDGDYWLTTAERIGETWKKTTTVCGEVSDQERTLLEQRLGDRVVLSSGAFSLRRAGFLAELAWQRIRAGDADDPAALQPIYLAPDQPVTA